MSVASTWRGVRLSEIYACVSPWDAPEYPPIKPGYNHTVLYHIPSNGSLPIDRPPNPQVGTDKWDHDHVRLPCSSRSLYPVLDETSGETHLKQRWAIIEEALSKPIRNSKELAEAILTYNTKFKDIWKFQALHKLFNKHLEEEETKYFFEVTLPQMTKLALSLPKLIKSPIPFLKKHNNKSVSMSQQQVACLLANAFFCTFPRRNTESLQSEYALYPRINFSRLYNSPGAIFVMEKIKCLCHYFRRVCTQVALGVVTVTRMCATPRDCEWEAAPHVLAAVPLHIDSHALIEDMDGLIQVDFANKYLGGGVLGQGCVQEEIRFVINPELMVSMLITEELEPNEAVLIVGCERYSDYVGYSGKFRWRGAHRDRSPVDGSRRRRVAVLALDALPCRRHHNQYNDASLRRELDKAWVGFHCAGWGAGPVSRPGVATGNWGCGAFRGSPRLKALLQLMAATRTARPLVYCTFGDDGLRDAFASVHAKLAASQVTVGRLYQYLLEFSKTDVDKNDVFEFIIESLSKEATTHTSVSPSSTQVLSVSDTASDAASDVKIIIETDTETTDDSELPASVQKEFMEQDWDVGHEHDVSMTDVESTPVTADSEVVDVTHSDDTEVASVNSASDEAATDQGKGRLIDEIDKLEHASGRAARAPGVGGLHVLRDSRHVRDPPANTQRVHADVSDELKKKIGKKITDYFSKKPV